MEGIGGTANVTGILSSYLGGYLTFSLSVLSAPYRTSMSYPSASIYKTTAKA
jgi:hypothetical protein